MNPYLVSINYTVDKCRHNCGQVCIHVSVLMLFKSLSHVQLFATLWTVACHAPLPMGFSRQESWSGLPFPSPGDLSNPGIKPGSSALQADSLLSEPPGKPKVAKVVSNSKQFSKGAKH